MQPRAFLFALGFGLLVRTATLPLPGNDDVIVWKIWSYAATEDLSGMFGVGGNPPERGIVRWGERTTTVNYPPFFLYEYGIVGRVFRALYPAYPDGLTLLIAVKLPILLANAGMTWLLYSAVRRVANATAPAQWAALLYWLNPATIFGGEMLGYVDPLFTLPAMGGLVLAYRGRRLLAGVLVATAIATKPQAILIGPAFALLLWRTGGVNAILQAGAAFAATLLAIVLPFIWRGAMGNMWLAFGSFYERRDTMSAYAANIGWIVNWLLRSWFGVPEVGWRAYLRVVPRPLAVSRFQELGYPNPRPICAALVAASIAWAIWVARRAGDLGTFAALGAFTVHAFFVLNIGMHENHQLLEIPLIVLAAALSSRLRPLALVVSALVTLNINFYYGIGKGWGWAIPRSLTGVDVSVVIAFANIATLVWFARELSALGRTQRCRDGEGLS